MAQHDSSPPAVSYSFQVVACIDGVTAPLRIEASSINELRRAVRNLAATGMIAPAAAAAQPSAPARCHTHGRELKASKKPGVKFCPAQDASGTYCSYKTAG